MSPEEFLLAQRTMLEALCGREWFHSQRRIVEAYPAYRRWQLCGDLAQRAPRFQIPQDLSQVRELLEIMLDTQSVVDCTQGDRHRIRIGDLANYGDERVRRRLSQVVLTTAQYHDALLELACAASHKAKGHEVVATEDVGMPDLFIKVPGWLHPLHVECKRQNQPNAEGWLRRVIEKANKQFKRHPTDGWGVVYLDVADVLPRAPVASSAEPSEVAHLTTRVEHHLREHYKSVSAVVLLWKEYRVSLTTLADSRRSALCCLFWKGKIIRHLRPRLRLPADERPILMTQTVCMRISAARDQESVMKAGGTLTL